MWIGIKNLNELSKNKLAILRRDHIGFVFQAYNLIPVLTVFENAEYVLLLQGVEPEERKERVMHTLGQLGIADKAKKRPYEISGGQQQRAAIARAIVSKPSIVLADEPTANLDSNIAIELIDLMRKLNEEENITFLHGK